MNITIDIPKEFKRDMQKDNFTDFFERVKADLKDNGMIVTDRLQVLEDAFKQAKLISDTEKNTTVCLDFPDDFDMNLEDYFQSIRTELSISSIVSGLYEMETLDMLKNAIKKRKAEIIKKRCC